MSDKTLGKARGLNSIADPSAFRGTAGRRRKEPAQEEETAPASTPAPVKRSEQKTAANQPVEERAAAVASPATKDSVSSTRPDKRRKRRELSVPHDIAAALENTAINPADIVMSAYRRHGDAIYAGAGGRPVSRGRSRLRLSLTDGDFDKVIRLGEVRGWNRSETVAVLVAFELMPETMELGPQT